MFDAAIGQLRADKPQPSSAKDALQKLLAPLDQPGQAATIAPGEAAALELARLPIPEIIAVAEKLRIGAKVFDVSFEPKVGYPMYAVRSYANGKVWNGLVDGTNGQAIDDATVTGESAVGVEDKAELMALKIAKVTLREAIASVERANGGRALNAGLEQVHGRAVWEIWIQDGHRSEQIHIDPITGKTI
ncbi:MAG TPA: PepSY domain-containing protein [Rhodopseudomonas sp.]|uniref:PepSY domain-containing protein n=1 Tax=Rhodopseudomonas sp. TaxID=1078 RepID=UPI002ED874C3